MPEEHIDEALEESITESFTSGSETSPEETFENSFLDEDYKRMVEGHKLESEAASQELVAFNERFGKFLSVYLDRGHTFRFPEETPYEERNRIAAEVAQNYYDQQSNDPRISRLLPVPALIEEQEKRKQDNIRIILEQVVAVGVNPALAGMDWVSALIKDVDFYTKHREELLSIQDKADKQIDELYQQRATTKFKGYFDKVLDCGIDEVPFVLEELLNDLSVATNFRTMHALAFIDSKKDNNKFLLEADPNRRRLINEFWVDHESELMAHIIPYFLSYVSNQELYIEFLGLTPTEVEERRAQNWSQVKEYITTSGANGAPITINDLEAMASMSNRGLLPQALSCLRKEGDGVHFGWVIGSSGGNEVLTKVKGILDVVNKAVVAKLPIHSFYMELSEQYADFILTHPFYDGNGTLGVFLLELAKEKYGIGQSQEYMVRSIKAGAVGANSYERRVMSALGFDFLAILNARKQMNKYQVYRDPTTKAGILPGSGREY
jgi:hypothetical protein